MKDKIYASALQHVVGLGNASLGNLFTYYESAKEAWHHVLHYNVEPSLGCKYELFDELRRPINESFLLQLEEDLERYHMEVITWESPYYPKSLLEIYNSPRVLYGRGNIEVLQHMDRSLAMVGARKCSTYGVQVARHFGRALSNLGIIVVSGGAMGIDRASHEGALQGQTPTIAVMGCGLNVTYPRTNRNLFLEILEKDGLLLSEYGPHMQAKSHHFPSRNRIISGMTRGTIVVEAKASSGSLITADMAINEGRDVFTIPGNVLTHTCDGNHWLIQQGATVLTDPEQVLREYGWQKVAKYSNMDSNKVNIVNEEEQSVLKAMNPGGNTTIEELVHTTQLPLSNLHTLLLQLELKQMITHTPQGYVLHT